MKGPFGMLLVGGGLILLVGLFTGKISFPGGGTLAIPNPLLSPNNPNPPPTNNVGNKKGWVNPHSDGSCPSGTSPIHVSGGKLVCQYN